MHLVTYFKPQHSGEQNTVLNLVFNLKDYTMSSIITGILSSTAGFLWSKARDSTAEKLQDGDVTDAKIREIVVRELDDIKKKLEGLSRKDLLSSCTLLQEGVDLLYLSLGELNLQQQALGTETEDDRAKTSAMTTGVESEILNEVMKLSCAMEKLKLNANSECEIAKKRFEDARLKANDAFSNEALSLKDKIFAVELRMVSEILERLDNPKIAITGCLSFLKKLHSLPAIQEVFNVYMNGGVKSLMNKAERVDTVKSIMLINYVLFEYVSKFGSTYPFVLAWPTIELTGHSFNPILSWQEISTRKSMGDELPQQSKGLKLDTIEHDFYFQVAVNGYGDVVGPSIGSRNSVIVISKTGEKKEIELPPTYRECKIVDQDNKGVAVDKNNNIYFVKWLKTRTVNGDEESLYVLYILDANYNVKQEYELDFLKGITGYSVFIAVKKNNDIVISKVNHLNLQSKWNDSEVFVCDDRGNLKHKFERKPCYWLHRLSISNKNEIMIGSGDDNAVYIYSEEGNLKSTVKPPEGHRIRGVAFHFVFSKIIVVTYVRKKNSYFLLCYTEEGELESTTYFCDRSDIRGLQIISHPNGPVAVVTWHEVESEFQEIVTFI